jgi:hypothetical protein
MSIEAMSLVLHHSKALGAAKLVLLGIANHQGDAGAFPAVSTLARYAGVSERRVQQILSELEQSGELVRHIQSGSSGQYKTNLYWVKVSCPEYCDGTSNHRAGVKPVSGRGETHFTLGVKPTSPEPLDKPSEEPNLAQAELERAFDEFWQAYPRRVGKLAAKKMFMKFGSEAQEIINGARRYAADRNLPAEQFIPHPATWLNRGSWTDGALPELQLSREEQKQRDFDAAQQPVEESRVRSLWIREQQDGVLKKSWEELTPANRAFLLRVSKQTQPLSQSYARHVEAIDDLGIEIPASALSISQALRAAGLLND